jgi:O-antigen/teichoic acid export membrane protein
MPQLPPAAAPAISFLMTAYRTESYIATAIESVLAQTRDDWELIVVDNGNSDKLANIVHRYTSDPRISLLRQENRGYSGGVGAAADAAVGKYVCVLDSDDTVEPTFCEQISDLVAADPHIDAIGCDAELFHDPDDGLGSEGYFKSIGRRSAPDPSRPATFDEMLNEGVPYYSGAIRREIWDAHGGYDPALPDVEPDVVLWLRLVAAGRDVRILPDKPARGRLRPNSTSRDPTNIDAFEERLQRAFVLVAQEHGICADAVAHAGMLRRLRYAQSLRKARSALLEGDVQTAEVQARNAFRHRRTLRVAAVLVGLRISPTLLLAIHPAKNRVARMLRRVRCAASAPASDECPAQPDPALVLTPSEDEPYTAVTTDLTGVLKRGAAMAAGGLVLAQLVTVVQTLVLGRLLGPTEVGIYAGGSVMMGFLIMFVQSGLSHALIQRERDVEDAANTVMVATLVTGIALAVVTLVTAPMIGTLFHDSRIGLVAAATSGMMVLHSLTSVPDALMQRAFRFKRRLIIDPIVSITFAIVAIFFAIRGFGAWAMVIGSYASITAWVVLSWSMAKWRPFHGRFSFKILRELTWFSVPLLVDGLSERFRETFEQVLVGRVLGTSSLGHFRYGYRIASMPSLGAIQICGYVLFPAFSRISGDKTRFRESFLRALGWIWFTALPIGALLVIFGEPLAVVLLGDEWREAGYAAAALAGVGIGHALFSVTGEAMKGAGRSSMLTWLAAISLGVGLPLIAVLVPYGLVAVGVAISAAYLVPGFVSVVMACRVVGFPFRDAAARLVPPTVSALVASAVLLPVEHFVVHSDQYPAVAALAWILAECSLFASIYIGTLCVLSPTWTESVRHAVARVGTAFASRSGRSLVASGRR